MKIDDVKFMFNEMIQKSEQMYFKYVTRLPLLLIKFFFCFCVVFSAFVLYFLLSCCIFCFRVVFFAFVLYFLLSWFYYRVFVNTLYSFFFDSFLSFVKVTAN